MQAKRAAMAAAAAVAAATALVSAPGAATQRAALHLDVTEWAVVPSAGLVPAGAVHVTVADVGIIPHRIVIVRTARWGVAALPANAAALARATVGRVLVVQPGEVASETVALAPGSYVAFDDLPGSRDRNGAVAFSVI